MGIASSDKNTIRKMSEIEAVIYDRFLSIKCPDEKVNIPAGIYAYYTIKKKAKMIFKSTRLYINS